MAVARKFKIKRIENPSARQVTFSKRRAGLFKKAHDLAVLCDAEVAVVIFSSKGKPFQFASPSIGSVLDRYTKNGGDSHKATGNSGSTAVRLLQKVGADSTTQFREKLKALQSNQLVGDDLQRLSFRDLIHLEQQLRFSLEHIRTKKEELFLKQVENVRDKVTDEARRASAKSKSSKQLLDSGLSKVTGSQNSGGQGGCERHCGQEVPQMGASLPLWMEKRELVPCGTLLPVATKRPVFFEDLNKSPTLSEE